VWRIFLFKSNSHKNPQISKIHHRSWIDVGQAVALGTLLHHGVLPFVRTKSIGIQSALLICIVKQTLGFFICCTYHNYFYGRGERSRSSAKRCCIMGGVQDSCCSLIQGGMCRLVLCVSGPRGHTCRAPKAGDRASDPLGYASRSLNLVCSARALLVNLKEKIILNLNPRGSIFSYFSTITLVENVQFS
jgi:hypothetical protein